MLRRWNILEQLDSEEEIAGHIEATLEECGPSALPRALTKAAQARVINQLAKETGIDRKFLCTLFLDSGENTDAPPLAPELAARVVKAFIAPVHV